jgi:hypothetical protein
MVVHGFEFRAREAVFAVLGVLVPITITTVYFRV